jgi:hypothetical protein
MSRDMEGVYQTKVTEKLQKLDESKQNVNKNFREIFFLQNIFV